MKLLLTAILLTACTWTSYAAELTGVWIGTYSYPEGSDQAPVTFSMVVKGGDIFHGKIIEPNTFGSPEAVALEADVTGKQEADGTISFSKKYNGVGDQRHTVWYKGKLGEKGMKGDWHIDDTTSGKFSIKKIADQ